MNILVLPSWYTSKQNPLTGIFFKEQTKALRNFGLVVSVLFVEFKQIKFFFDEPSSILFKNSFEIEDNIPTYRKNGLNIISLRFLLGRKLWIYLSYRFVEKYIKENGLPDLIHAHCYWAGYVAAKIKSKYKIPYLLTIHSSEFRNEKVLKYKKFYEESFDQANYLSAVSSSHIIQIKKYCSKNYSIQVIPNFIESSFFSFINNSESSKSRGIKFVTIGGLIDLKNHILILKAFKEILEYSKLKFTLSIIGEGDQEKKLKKFVSEHGLKNYVHFLGSLNRNNVRKILANSDIYLHASKYESFGVSLIEAMGLGLSAVVMRCGGVAEDFSSKNLIVCDDFSSFKQGILSQSENYEEKNREIISREVYITYSDSVVCEMIKSIYEKIINKS